MKWIAAVDPKREIEGSGSKMLHFAYDEIRRLGPGPVDPEVLKRAIYEAKADWFRKNRHSVDVFKDGNWGRYDGHGCWICGGKSADDLRRSFER
jgi:hypothetical protein